MALDKTISDQVWFHLLPLKAILDASDVTEVMVNGDAAVFVERRGGIKRVDVALPPANVTSALQLLATAQEKSVKAGTELGLIGAELPGLRIQGVLPPTATRGPALSIRKHSVVEFTLEDFVRDGLLDEQWADYLAALVRAGENMLVAGGTGSGKTTWLNALVQKLPDSRRIVSIEDTQELRVRVPNWLPLKTNEQRGVTATRLLETTLRLRPDSILLGELRGGEAATFLEALNTGHSGCMTTLHANSAQLALRRLEVLVMRSEVPWPLTAVRNQIASTIRYVIFVARVGDQRRLTQVLRLDGYDAETSNYEVSVEFDLSSRSTHP
jgi:Flp pilus assembly CpaF family ATPase